MCAPLCFPVSLTHFLGSKPHQVWDYIYLGADLPASSPIPTELLQASWGPGWACTLFARHGQGGRRGHLRFKGRQIMSLTRIWPDRPQQRHAPLGTPPWPCLTTLPPRRALPLLQKMKREFEYWYPFDLRVSGKDLIQVGWVGCPCHLWIKFSCCSGPCCLGHLPCPSCQFGQLLRGVCAAVLGTGLAPCSANTAVIGRQPLPPHDPTHLPRPHSFARRTT